jgi:hypothetical protein
LVFVEISFEEFEEAVGDFFFEDYGLGEKSVAGGIAGGIAFALFGGWASGTGSVGFRCANLLVGWHEVFWPQINADGRGWAGGLNANG